MATKDTHDTRDKQNNKLSLTLYVDPRWGDNEIGEEPWATRCSRSPTIGLSICIHRYVSCHIEC